jgi:hypothetical protein
MDGIILHFKRTSKEDVDRTLFDLGVQSESYQDDKGCYFYLKDYSMNELQMEYDEKEKKQLFKMLGGEPSCSYSLLSRQNDSAGIALKFTIELLKTYPDCIIDDDFDSLWTMEQLLKHYQQTENPTIFSLRVER